MRSCPPFWITAPTKDNDTLVHPEEDWYPPCPVGGR